MKVLSPSLIFFAISPVLASGVMSSWTNALVRRANECYPVSLQFPGPDDHPCGLGYTIGNCNCCPDGLIGCLSPVAVCAPGLVGNYVCVASSGSGTITPQCFAGDTPCGSLCMPVGSNCCDTVGHYCPASEQCAANPDGSNVPVCSRSTQAAPTSAKPTIQASATAGGVKTTSPPSPSSDTAISTGSISTKGGTSASQAAVSFGTSIQKSSWGFGGTFAVIVTILLS